MRKTANPIFGKESSVKKGAKQMRESEFLRKYLDLVEIKLPWGPRKGWTTYNFSRLSQNVKEASGITLSTRTLRRLCNNHRNYKPQTATKDALAIYLGYRDWEEFKTEVRGSHRGNVQRNITPGQNFRSFMSMAICSVWFYLILGLTTLLVLTIVFYPDLMLKLNSARVDFSSNYVIGTAPQKVTFYYDVSRINSSNIFINKNFYDDGDIIPINKNRRYFTTDFELPDHYSVKIIANGERISCIRIHVITDGWEGVINGNHIGRLVYGNGSGILAFHPDSIRRYTLGEMANVLEFRNIREFGLLGDQMKLETELRHLHSTAGNDCTELTIQIITLHGRVGFTFVKQGCPPSLLNAEFGDVLLNGEFQNLDAFYQDFSDWRKVSISIHDKKIFVYLENRLIYKVKYSDPLDEVKGITFKFRGSGEVKYVKLFDKERALVYEDNF